MTAGDDIHAWIYTAMFGLIAALVIGNNLYHACIARIRHESTSFTLFIGGIFGAISLLVAPVPALRWFAFVPALIDPGTIGVIYGLARSGKGN